MNDISIFLGANTSGGFYSLYEEAIAALDPRRLYVIKGSAGCGKSGFMRRVAERAGSLGEEVVRVLCSGDPDSLDGVILPRRGLAVFDGTAPHVLEPTLTGEKGFYIDLSRFYTHPAKNLLPLTEEYKEHYRRAYLYLSAAGSLRAASLCPADAAEAIRRRAVSLGERSLRREKAAGPSKRIFTDAFTCKGTVSLPETLRAITPKLIALTGGRARSEVFFRAMREVADARGQETVICPDPLDPDRIAHLLLPGAGFGITTGVGDRRIHLEKLGSSDEAEKVEEREAAQLRESLLHKAEQELRRAKGAHDRLEAAVNPCIDFAGVSRTAEEFLEKLFG